ncbi:MAG: GTPase HflX, partial [Candidatus Competibacteraceae bacterium]|nr:GTPase HflX [Candidatus Competibacteraceae bacterium]MCB1814758.1 GTPase HflX [Candidatus Competibacteraceae bacterium]
VAAFRSTLQETTEATLLLHVIDASDPERDFYTAQVEQVLTEIGAATRPVIKIFNKIDRLSQPARLERNTDGHVQAVWLSALTGEGLDLLYTALAEHLRGETVHTWVRLPPSQGKLRARLFTLQAVVNEQLSADGEWLIEVQTSRKNLNQLCRDEGFRNEWLESVH